MVGIFSTAGQICSATSRVLVEDSLYDELLSQLTAAASRLRVGDPLLMETQMGPVASKEQFKRVNEAVDRARAKGVLVVAPEISLDIACDDELSDGWVGGWAGAWVRGRACMRSICARGDVPAVVVMVGAAAAAVPVLVCWG